MEPSCRPHQPPLPSTLATICYTLGTTGTPKGVMLTHGNVIADATTLLYFKLSGIVDTDVMISFLPLAHMLERLVEAVCFMVGARAGFYRGDISGLAYDIKEFRPTVLPIIPRVLNRLYDKVMSEMNKSRVIAFKNIREGMGGRVKLMITGSAPLADNVLTFVRAAMGCVVVEGYDTCPLLVGVPPFA